MTDAERIIQEELKESHREWFTTHNMDAEDILQLYHKYDENDWQEFTDRIEEVKNDEAVNNILTTATDKIENHEETAKTTQKLKEAVITNQITEERITKTGGENNA